MLLSIWEVLTLEVKISKQIESFEGLVPAYSVDFQVE